MLGKGYLCAVVTQDAANWPTPDASNHRDGEVLRKDNNLEQGGFHGVSLHHAMTKYGLPAQANPSTDGSRQELWPTITAHTPDMESSGPNGNSGTYLAGAVKAEENWVTPRTSGTSTRPNKTTPRQGLTLIEQAREQEKAWATPQASDHIEGARTAIGSNQKCLGRDLKTWATPQAKDHKSGRGNKEREYKELTPMVERTQSGKLNPRWVETLMGLPVGWVMPSCASPATIAPTSCDCSETELCQPPQSKPSKLF